MDLADARTWLFVPGDQPGKYAKAVASGADAVIVDLEDAVDSTKKEFARRSVFDALEAGCSLTVRVSAADTEDFLLDCEALRSASRPPSAVILAKAEETSDLALVVHALGCEIVPLIESARGLLVAQKLAETEGVVRLGFGAVDFSVDIGASPDDDVLAYARSHLVATSRAAGIAPPLDTPSLDIDDTEGIAAAAHLAKRFGMGGKFCIHPAQVPIVAKSFAPTPQEIAEARMLLANTDSDGAATFRGRMIDRPVLERARRLLLAGGDST